MVLLVRNLPRSVIEFFNLINSGFKMENDNYLQLFTTCRFLPARCSSAWIKTRYSTRGVV